MSFDNPTPAEIEIQQIEEVQKLLEELLSLKRILSADEYSAMAAKAGFSLTQEQVAAATMKAEARILEIMTTLKTMAEAFLNGEGK